jgi:hypothetical protein
VTRAGFIFGVLVLAGLRFIMPAAASISIPLPIYRHCRHHRHARGRLVFFAFY